VKCNLCGNEFNAMEGGGQCPFCGNTPGFGGGGESAPPPRGAPARGDTAWERRRSWIDLSAMFEMVRQVLIEPISTFRRMKTAGDIGSPMLFAVLLGTVGGLGALVWNQVLQGLYMMNLQRFIDMPEGFAAQNFALSAGMMIISALMTPVFVAIGLFVSAGILHLCLLITGGANNGFEATFRVAAYCTGATALFQLLPVCGGFIVFFWGVAIQILGVREIHETDTWRAVVAVLLPLAVCCGCAILGFGSLMGIVIMAAASGQ